MGELIQLSEHRPPVHDPQNDVYTYTVLVTDLGTERLMVTVPALHQVNARVLEFVLSLEDVRPQIECVLPRILRALQTRMGTLPNDVTPDVSNGDVTMRVTVSLRPINICKRPRLL